MKGAKCMQVIYYFEQSLSVLPELGTCTTCSDFSKTGFNVH